MSKVVITDDALKQAAALVREAMLDAIPGPEECGHVFSPEFEEKIEGLMKTERRRGRRRAIARRIAAAVLAVLVGAGAWLAVDKEARAAFVGWVREVYENKVVYWFTGVPEGELPVYRPTWVPDGFVEVTVLDEEESQAIVYQSEDDVFVFVYYWMSESGNAAYTATDGGEWTEVSVGEYPGHYYAAASEDVSNDLVWLDEDTRVAFTISAYLSYEEIMHIAERVELVKTPK